MFTNRSLVLASALAIGSAWLPTSASSAVGVESAVTLTAPGRDARTDIVGATLRRAGRVNQTIDGGAVIYADSSALARSDFGASKVAVSGRWTSYRSGAFAGAIGADATASSSWRDDWTVHGAASDNYVPLDLHVRISGRFDLTPEDRLNHGSEHELIAEGATFQLQSGLAGPTWDTSDFFHAADPAGNFALNRSVTAWVPVGSTFDVGAIYAADVRSGNFVCHGSDSSCSALASFESTATIDRIDLPAGYSVTAGSGKLVAQGDHFGYIGAVPEPGTYTLMLAGLAGMVSVTRRRLTTRLPQPADRDR